MLTNYRNRKDSITSALHPKDKKKKKKKKKASLSKSSFKSNNMFHRKNSSTGITEYLQQRTQRLLTGDSIHRLDVTERRRNLTIAIIKC